MAKQSQKTVPKLKAFKNELSLRLGLLLQGKAHSPQQLQEMTQLAKLNDSIKEAYQALNQANNDPTTEYDRLRDIRALEDQRFQLLNQINGSNLVQYNTLPLEVD